MFRASPIKGREIRRTQLEGSEATGSELGSRARPPSHGLRREAILMEVRYMQAVAGTKTGTEAVTDMERVVGTETGGSSEHEESSRRGNRKRDSVVDSRQ